MKTIIRKLRTIIEKYDNAKASTQTAVVISPSIMVSILILIFAPADYIGLGVICGFGLSVIFISLPFMAILDHFSK